MILRTLAGRPRRSRSNRNICLQRLIWPWRRSDALSGAAAMPESSPQSPRKVVLFSGHMIDAPDRETPRFPPDKEPLAAQAIAEALANLHVGPDDLCICGGACGGDLLFAEA